MGKIIHHEDTDERMITDSLLLFRVQDQIDGVMVVVNDRAWLDDAGSASHAGHAEPVCVESNSLRAATRVDLFIRAT